jgi:hypothetical protein
LPNTPTTGKKFKKCCLAKAGEQERLAEMEWQKWFAKDQAEGQANLAAYEATMPPITPAPSPAFAQGSEGEKLFKEMEKDFFRDKVSRNFFEL